MKAAALPLSLILMLAALSGPAMAQDEPTGIDTTVVPDIACLRVTGDLPLDGMEASELGQLLLDGSVQVEVLAAESCTEPEPEPAPEEQPQKKAKGTPYTKFASRGAAAAIELAILAERHEGANTLKEIDAASRSLAKWAAKQRKWLSNHPPQACYKGVHKKWRKSVVDIKQGADGLSRAISQARWADVAPAVQQVGAGLTRAANVDLEAVTERCVEAA